MKTRHLREAIAAVLLVVAAPGLASNTGVTIQIPAAVTSVAASDVTVLDVAGYFANTQAEGVFAELYREGWRTYADTASLPEDDLSGCDGTNRIAMALVSTQTGGPLLYLCPATAGSWTPLFVPVGAVTSSQLTMATSRLLGRTTASAGAVEEITVSSPLSLSGGALGVGTVGVANGGTGVTSLTAYAPVCGGTTTTGAVQSCGTGIGNIGYVLTTTGATSLPTWQAAAGGGISGLGTTADKVVCTTTSDSAAKACDSSTTLPAQLTTYGADATPLTVKGNAAGSARGSLKIAGDSGDGCQFYGPSSNNSYLICPSAIQISAGSNGLLLFTTRTEMGGPLYVKRPHQNSTATSGAPRALTGDTSSPGDSNSIFTNTSASAETHFNLQDAAIGNEGSYVYTFVVTDADGMQINASSGDVINNATTACATSGFIASNTIGSTITLAAVDATNWWVIAIAGTWTCDV